MTEIRKIFIDGKEVDPSQLQQLPNAVREVLADKNNNGIPDALEGLFDHPMVQQVMQKAGYHSFDQLPPELRAKLQGLMGKLGGMTGANAGVQVNRASTTSMSGMPATMPMGSSPTDWRQSYSLEEPKSISVKTIIFATAMVFAIVLAAAIALLAFWHR